LGKENERKDKGKRGIKYRSWVGEQPFKKNKEIGKEKEGYSGESH